jgi:pyruvate dehydrogenase E2 component (dihydrolipoamide acetyltransferase)
LAEARCIDPSRITGSGPGGRILERDVTAWLEANRYDEIRITPAAKRLAAQAKVDLLTVRGTGVGRRIMIHDIQRALAARPRKMNKMRQTIARRLTESFTTTPHFYATTSVDLTDLLAWRQELKNQGEAYKVTDFILEAVVLALQEFPLLNSVAEGNTIRWRENVDLGLAVGLDDGLVVPVIWSAETLSLRELAQTAAALAAKARAGKLLPDEMSGSSFTVSNMGMLDVENFSAIINPGESGILAVASALATPVVRNGKIVVRSMMKITASVDHRIVDGAVAARFINAVKAKLEDLELWRSLT